MEVSLPRGGVRRKTFSSGIGVSRFGDLHAASTLFTFTPFFDQSDPGDFMLNKIITHGGGAHKDEFLACCVLLTEAAVAVERRDPTENEMEDSMVGVVDVGHRFEPELSNFDHHQFPRDHEPTCALSLVLRKLGLYASARQFCEWLEVTEWFDCRGAVATGEWLSVERETLAKLNSPIDVTLLRRFAASREHVPGEPLWEVMRMIGEDLVEYVRGMRARLDFVRDHAEVWSIPCGTDIIEAIYLPRTDPLPADPAAGLGRYVEALGKEESVRALVYPDSRGEGYGLKRFADHPALDFTRIDSEDDVHFTHKQGFIAKTSACDAERLRELLVGAYTDSKKF